MELDEWELLPNTKPLLEFDRDGKDLLSKKLFLTPDLFLETNYFKCPTQTDLNEKNKKPKKEFKDIGVSKEFDDKNINWVEPEPIRFDRETAKTKNESIEEAKQVDFNEKTGGEIAGECLERERGDFVGFNILGLRVNVNGLGALCSLGVTTAATLCFFIFGGRMKQRTDPKIQFQIYADDKRIKEVMQRATRLNQATSAARNAQIARAQISFGGYYEGL